MDLELKEAIDKINERIDELDTKIQRQTVPMPGTTAREAEYTSILSAISANLKLIDEAIRAIGR